MCVVFFGKLYYEIKVHTRNVQRYRKAAWNRLDHKLLSVGVYTYINVSPRHNYVLLQSVSVYEKYIFIPRKTTSHHHDLTQRHTKMSTYRLLLYQTKSKHKKHDNDKTANTTHLPNTTHNTV